MAGKNKNASASNMPAGFKALLGDFYNVAKETYEAGYNEGFEFCMLAWTHHLSQVKSYEDFRALTSQVRDDQWILKK